MAEVQQIERKHVIEDEHFLFEKHSKPLLLVVFNQGDESIEDASLTLTLPRHDAFYVADRLPRKMINGELVELGSAELADYPAVNIKDDLIHISSTLGEVQPHMPVKVFSTPVRICVGSELSGRRVGIRYSLFGRNLRSPRRVSYGFFSSKRTVRTRYRLAPDGACAFLRASAHPVRVEIPAIRRFHAKSNRGLHRFHSVWA